MTSQTGKQTITIPNISRSKGKHRICGGETSPKLFSKRSKVSISLDRQSRVLYSLFLLYVQVEGYQNMFKLTCRQLAFNSHKAFLKIETWIQSPSLIFYMTFKENYLMLDSITWSNFIAQLPLLLQILGNMYCNCFPSCDIINETQLSYRDVFPHDQKGQDKMLNILRTKRI